MMIFAGFSALILLLIFFGLKIQNLQKQLMLSQSSLKTTSRRMNETSDSMIFLAKQIQSFLMERFESSHKRGLINSKQFETLYPMFDKINVIASLCMEKGMSVEEALNAALQDSEVTLENIREIVKVQESGVRMAWSKNTLDGFISVCKTLSYPVPKTENTKP